MLTLTGLASNIEGDSLAEPAVSSGLSLRHRYHAGIRLRTSEYFH